MGFGAEIRGFISAMAAGEKLTNSDDRQYKRLRNQVLKQKADQLADPENQKLDKDLKRARAQRLLRGPQARPMNPAQERALDARTNFYEERLKQLKNPTRAPSAADDVGGGGYGPAPSQGAIPPGPQSALEPGEGEDASYDTAELEPDMQDDGLDYEDQPTQFASRGGAIKVRHYAEGGAVDDDDDDYLPAADDSADDDDEDDDAIDGAIPEQGAAPQGSAAAAPATPAASGPGYSPQAAHDATLAGIKYAQKATGVSMKEGAVDVSSQSRQGARRAYATGVGAATPDEMNAVRKAIDPEGKMSESERNMAALAHVYEWNLKQNNPQGAARAAASMTQYFRQVSDRYKALAAAAAEHGDVDGSMRAILKAHANVPDGKDMKLVKRPDGSVAYSFTDVQSGKTVEQGVASPEQILAFATKGAAHSFDDLVARASGERAGTKPAKPERAPKLADREKASEAINTIADDPKAVKLDPDLADPLKHVATQIFGQNDVSAKDALSLAGALGEASDFKFKPNEAGGGYTVQTPDGRSINLTKDAVQNLAVLRGKAKIKADVAAKKMAEDEARETKRKGLESQAGASRTQFQADRPTEMSRRMQQRDTRTLPQQGIPVPTGQPSQLSDAEQINMARRSAGLPLIDPSRIGQQAGAIPIYD